MTISNVNIELLTRVILYIIYSQNMKELSMSVASDYGATGKYILTRYIRSAP